MTSLRHESRSRANAWRVSGVVCAHAGPVPPLVASASPLEDHLPLAPASPCAPMRATTRLPPLHSYRRVCPCFTIPKKAGVTLSHGLVQ
jgi:hypothetical protein